MKENFSNLDANKLCAAVVIGRNEGQRLISCLELLKSNTQHVVYVDSGSTDNSIAEAQILGIESIKLDLSVPFTAARARNEGAKYLVSNYLDVGFIQFIDGDCEIQLNWIDEAYKFLLDNDDYAVACGRRRERFPEKSIYNQLCDIEWNTPIGDVKSCGGDALIRVSAFREVGGYNSSLIAGEEPEMCFRLRKYGWKIRRMDIEMTLHDAAMTKMSQWWNRAKRSGYAYANGYYLHGSTAERFKLKELRSITMWALCIPMAIVLATFISVFSLVFILLYPAQIIKNVLKLRMLKKMTFNLALLHTTSNLFAKLPQLIGVIMFVLNQMKNKEGRLIEYK